MKRDDGAGPADAEVRVEQAAGNVADAPVAAGSVRWERPAPLPQWQQDWREPLNCSIVFTDVAGFSDPVRNDGDRDVVRAAMYEILRSAFEASGVPWADPGPPGPQR